MADALVELQKKYSENTNENFAISISRNELASMVGTSPETVIRTLSDFKEEKLIAIKGSKITIVKFEALAHLRF